jgi:hypothetical protein
MRDRDLAANMERGLRGLSSVPMASGSSLSGYLRKNLVVTSDQIFLSHLKRVVYGQSSSWCFKVTSDAELVTAWLGSIGLQGKDILDPDAYSVSTQYVTIPDLALPPELLIIRMGVKVARNQAASEVLAEAINIRFHESKPTWIWEEPHYPLNPGHMFWSDRLGASLSQHFDRVSDLGPVDTTKVPNKVKHISISPTGIATIGSNAGSGKKSLRGGGK